MNIHSACPPRPAGVAGVITVRAAAALLTAACGGSSSSTSAGSGGAPSAGGSAHTVTPLAFARCVRAHGVPNFPDPDSSGNFNKQVLRQLGVSDARMRAAEAPCGDLAPAGQQAPLTAAQQQDYLRAAACMRSHGISVFPDPVFSGGGVRFPSPPAGVATSSPQFVHARQTCERLIPAGLPYSGSE
jgi:hypothetical protein